MIINTFLPEKFRSYYLISQKILAISITKNMVIAAVCTIKGNKRIIEQLLEQPIDLSEEFDIEDKITEALTHIKNNVASYDKLFAVFPSSGCIFKEISLPFTDIDKIKAVIPFEIEPLLPFTIDSAIIDSIVTKTNAETKNSDILVVATKRSGIEEFLNLFKKANLTVDKITTSSLEIYSFYLQIPEFKNLTDITAIINLGISDTEIIILEDNQIKHIRTINKAISLNNSSEIFQAIEFTLSSYTRKSKNKINIILSGIGLDEIPSIINIAKDNLNMNVYEMNAKNILYTENLNDKISSKVTAIPNSYLTSLATSLNLPITENFNLQKIEVNKKEFKLLGKQIILAIILTLLPILSLTIFGFLHVKNIKKNIYKEEQTSINNLKKYFKLNPRIKNLEMANKEAKKELNKQETASHNLSEESRYSLLRYLIEISKCLNLKDTKLEISQLSILLGSTIDTPSEIKLYGSVPNYDYLNKLQTQLQCPIFRPIGKLYELNFKTNPIELIIKE